MPSIFSINKKTTSFLLINIGLLLLSLPLIQSNPNSNIRTSSPGVESGNFRTLAAADDGEDDDNEEEDDNSDGGSSSSSYGCWIQSYGRGVGKPISTCPSGQDNDASLCYPQCQSGYTGVGPVCWQNCPSGFTDTGADCLKPGSYGRGAGYVIWEQSQCDNDNPQGCEQYGALWYPNCAANYHNVGCCVCSPNCPSDMTDIGVSCQKQSYGRGVGTPLTCASNQEEDAALCYTPCKSGYKGDGPVCWGQCPSGMYQCGALCVESESDCVGDMLSIANQVLNGISDYAEGEEDVQGALITIANTGVNIGEQLAQYKQCTNM